MFPLLGTIHPTTQCRIPYIIFRNAAERTLSRDVKSCVSLCKSTAWIVATGIQVAQGAEKVARKGREAAKREE